MTHELDEHITFRQFRNFVYFALIPAAILLVASLALIYHQTVNAQHGVNSQADYNICYGAWQRWHGRENLRTTFEEFFTKNPDKVLVAKYQIVLDKNLPSLPSPQCTDPFADQYATVTTISP